jgi:hypothetical protein
MDACTKCGLICRNADLSQGKEDRDAFRWERPIVRTEDCMERLTLRSLREDHEKK